MKKDSKILKKVIELTNKGEIEWTVKRFGGSYKLYSSVYKITNNKLIKIDFFHDGNQNHMDSLVFTFFNSEKKIEIKEVYPYNKISPFAYYQLKNLVKKLNKTIEEKKPVNE
jgi:uncharacterized iron-regulated protein